MMVNVATRLPCKYRRSHNKIQHTQLRILYSTSTQLHTALESMSYSPTILYHHIYRYTAIPHGDTEQRHSIIAYYQTVTIRNGPNDLSFQLFHTLSHDMEQLTLFVHRNLAGCRDFFSSCKGVVLSPIVSHITL